MRFLEPSQPSSSASFTQSTTAAASSATDAELGDPSGAEVLAGVEGGGEGADEGAMALAQGSNLDALKALVQGEVVAVLQRDQKDVVVCLPALPAGQGNGPQGVASGANGGDGEEDGVQGVVGVSLRAEDVTCYPLDRRLPLVRIRTRQAAKLRGQRFVVRTNSVPLVGCWFAIFSLVAGCSCVPSTYASFAAHQRCSASPGSLYMESASVMFWSTMHALCLVKPP